MISRDAWQKSRLWLMVHIFGMENDRGILTKITKILTKIITNQGSVRKEYQEVSAYMNRSKLIGEIPMTTPD